MSAPTSFWLFDRRVEAAFILAPPLVAVLVALGLTWTDAPMDDTPLWAWVVLVLGIDVAHVYSTLYRTYLAPGALRHHRELLLTLPAIAWLAGVLLYSWDGHLFWRLLAYVAVFHFVRQQYGLMRLYSVREPLPRWRRHLDTACIYLATLYPLLYWHTHPRAFHWFIPHDFLLLDYPGAATALGYVYALCLLGYAILAIRDARHGAINWPKHLVLTGTAAAWYVGIVWLDGDLPFTLTNVVAHGVPYLALVWLKARAEQRHRPQLPLWLRSALVFVALVLILAFLEEALWDGFVWRERGALFPGLHHLPDLRDSHLLMWIVPTLALPQLTHYLLDAWIWRRQFQVVPPSPPSHAA